MKKILSSTPVLGFLFLFNAIVAIVAGFVLDGSQQVLTVTGMGVVSIGAGIALVQKLRGSTTSASLQSV